jgi:hypothetical protein
MKCILIKVDETAHTAYIRELSGSNSAGISAILRDFRGFPQSFQRNGVIVPQIMTSGCTSAYVVSNGGIFNEH